MFSLQINTDNAAFQDADKRWEIARMLRALADEISRTTLTGGFLDSNGNCVGDWKFEASQDELEAADRRGYARGWTR
jgi:hypothetical protein